MSTKIEDGGPALNTDREIWRERPGDFYADSIHATASGSIGIDCGGMVYTLPVREWHKLAGERGVSHPDMSLREWYRGQALAGLCANPGGPFQANASNGWDIVNCTADHVAAWCDELADAMLSRKSGGAS